MPRTTSNCFLIGLSCDNSADNVLSYAEHLANNFLNSVSRSVKASYFGCLIVSEFCQFVIFTTSVWITVALRCVSGVFKRRSKVQVVGVYARTIVAFVKNPFVLWNRSVRKLPRYSMSVANNAVHAHFPVSFVMSVSKKHPAFVNSTNVNPVPKSFGHWNSFFDVNFHPSRMINFEI